MSDQKTITTPTWPTRHMFSEIRIRLVPDSYTPRYMVEGKTKGFFSIWQPLGRFYCNSGEEELGLRRAKNAANHYWENHG